MAAQAIIRQMEMDADEIGVLWDNPSSEKPNWKGNVRVTFEVLTETDLMLLKFLFAD